MLHTLRKLLVYILIIIWATNTGFGQACVASTNFKASRITHKSVNLSWKSGSGKGYRIEWVTAGSLPTGNGNGVFTTDTFVNFNTLQSSSLYQFYLRDSCAPNTYSNWIGPLKIKTTDLARFETPRFQIIPRSGKILATADINGDLKSDILMLSPVSSDVNVSNKLLVYLQTNTFAISILAFIYSIGKDTANALNTGDFNGDLKQDAIVGFGDSVVILLQNSIGELNRQVALYSGMGVYDIEVGELNNDGISDFAVYHTKENSVSVFYSTPSGFIKQTYACITAYRGQVGIGDLNSDGLNDLAVMTANPPQINVFYNTAVFTFGAPIILNSTDTTQHIFETMQVGDLLGNGTADILVSKRTKTRMGATEIWYQTPSGLVNYNQNFANGHSMGLGDLNCDGFNEIYSILGNVVPNGGQRHLFQNNYYDPNSPLNKNNSLNIYSSYQTSLIDQYHPRSIVHADFDGDFKPDVALASLDKGLVLLFNKSDLEPKVIRDSAITFSVAIFRDTTNIPTDTQKIVVTDTLIGFYRQTITNTIFSNTYVITTTNIDSVKLEYKAFCSFEFKDTAYYAHYIRDTILLKIDTTVLVSEQLIPWETDDFDSNLAIFPNPTKGLLYIKILGNTENVKIMTIEIYNDFGKRIGTETLQFTELGILDLQPLASGAYRLLIKWNNLIFERSVIRYKS